MNHSFRIAVSLFCVLLLSLTAGCLRYVEESNSSSPKPVPLAKLPQKQEKPQKNEKKEIKDQSAWPMGRGNRLQSGVAKTTLPDKLATLWTFKAEDAFEGTAAIVDGIVYAASYDEFLYAIDLKTGKQKWKYKMGATKSAATVFRGSVYIGDEEGWLHAVDAKTGKGRWKFETRGEITAAPNIYKDKLIVSSWDNNLYCLTTDGKKVWSAETGDAVNGAPAIVGNRTFVAGCDSILHIIELEKGKEVDSLDLGGQVAATAAVKDNHLYVGTMTEQVLGVDLQKNKVAWVFQPKRRSQPFFASAAVTDSLVVVGSRDRKVYALDRKTGKKVWEFDTDGRVDPSPVIVGKRVYAPSMNGKLFVLDLMMGGKLQELTLGRTIIASPAVAQGRLVIGTVEGVLFCLGSKHFR